MKKTTHLAAPPVAFVAPTQIDPQSLNRSLKALGSTSSNAATTSQLRKNGAEDMVVPVIGFLAIVGLAIWASGPQRQLQQEYAETLKAYRRKLAESKSDDVPAMPPPPVGYHHPRNYPYF